MGSNLFTSALSAMNAAQAGMATTQHNIANASTPGFTRQEVVIGSRAGQQTGAGFVGAGVDVSGVIRIYDQYLTNQVRLEQTQSSYLTTYHSAMKQIDNLVADPVAGASPAMQDFFNAMNGVANNPESIPARQTLLGTAQFVVNRFQAIDQRMTDIADGLGGQITRSISTVNAYAQQISTLNGNIKRAIANGQGQLPNDLLDQRDQVINQLNQEIKVNVQFQLDGSGNVYIGNGQALVIDEKAMRLDAVRSETDPSKLDIVYRDGNDTTLLQQSGLQGGNLGAYLAFRDQSLEPARNALGRVAMGLAAKMNEQNQLGLDLNGALGGNIFNVGVPRVEKGINNVGSAVAMASISDASQLTTSDYQLRYDGSNYTMVRLSDNTTTSVGTTAVPPSNVEIDGFTFSLTSGAQKDDTFLIRPTADGARDISVAISNPAKIAAAAPVRTAALLSATTTASPTTTVASGAISGSVVSVAGTTASTATFTVDGKTLFTNTIAAGSTGTLITGANLDTAWTVFAAANAGYTRTGTFAAGTAQIAKADGMPITLAETQTTGTGATLSVFAAAGAGFIGVTPSTKAGVANITANTPNNANLANPVTITFASPTTYTVTGAIPDVSGVQTYTAPSISYNGWTMQLGGPAPAAGNVFNIAANSGSANISSGTVNPPPPATPNPANPTVDLNLQSPVSIIFTSPTTFNVVGTGTGNPVSLTYPTASGSITYNGWTAQISGTPAAGDVFTVGANTSATGDNRNALLLAGMQNQNLMAGNTTTFQGAYGQLVGEVGAKTHELDVTSQAQINMTAQTVAAQQSVSGVNLDEEAANLMLYQRAYQAAAKAMQIANSMFDALLSIGG